MKSSTLAAPWTATHLGRNVIRVDIHTDKPVGWSQEFLLTGDRHHDNAKTDHDLEERHLRQAVEKDAGIIDCGDLHDAMQGKWDKRADTSQCRPEQQEGRYLDSLVDCAADFYRPYARNWLVMGRGNHEQSILKRHETDLTERTVQAINSMEGTTVQAGGYGGWVLFHIHRQKAVHSFRLKYFHGSGGGGPVTRGVIQTNRQAVFLPDAHIVLTGHVHEQWQVVVPRERINKKGVISLDEQIHVKTGTYKDEYADGHSGWHIERGAPPKPLGGWWLRFYYRGNGEFSYDLRRTD